MFPWEAHGNVAEAFADSDWAGNKKSSKSTSGGVMRWGGHVLKTWSSTESTIALSSGEAELYALTKACCQMKGLMALGNDFGVSLNGFAADGLNSSTRNGA